MSSAAIAVLGLLSLTLVAVVAILKSLGRFSVELRGPLSFLAKVSGKADEVGDPGGVARVSKSAAGGDLKVRGSELAEVIESRAGHDIVVDASGPVVSPKVE